MRLLLIIAEILSFVITYLDLDLIISSEISWSQKDEHRTLSHFCGNKQDNVVKQRVILVSGDHKRSREGDGDQFIR